MGAEAVKASAEAQLLGDPLPDDEIAALRAQIDQLRAQVENNDDALRHLMGLLVDWLEEAPKQGSD